MTQTASLTPSGTPQAQSAIDRARHMLSVALFLPIEKIDENADLRSLEKMDSLSFEMVVAQIEQTLHREIDPLELLKLTSVRDLAALLERES
jgi:acyl carrier protein